MDKLTVYAWPKENNAKKNPYNKILYEGMGKNVVVKEFSWKTIMNDSSCNILHLHWPDHMLRLKSSWRIHLRMYRFLSMITALKKRGVKIIWTVHNLEPHECHHKKLMLSGMKKIISIMDGFIFLSDASRQEFISKYRINNSQKSTVIPHLHYRSYFKASDKNTALSQLIPQAKAKQILCFGVIREHKGFDKLFELVMNSPFSDELGWMLAGNPGKHKISDGLMRIIGSKNVVYSALRHIEDEEIPELFSAADAIFLPYENIHNSGTAILSLSLNRRVIAPALGSLIELQKQVGSSWLHLYQAPLNADTLNESIRWIDSPTETDAPNLDFMSPESISKDTSKFYRMVLDVS